jgi:hypothetical protein
MVNTNDCYVTNADMKGNLAYGICETTTSSQQLTQNQAANIPAEPNQCCGIATPPVDPDQLLSQNEAYTATSILVDPNQCYGIGTENADNSTPTIGDYDYVACCH